MSSAVAGAWPQIDFGGSPTRPGWFRRRSCRSAQPRRVHQRWCARDEQAPSSHREADAAPTLLAGPPAVVELHGVGASDGRAYLVMGTARLLTC